MYFVVLCLGYCAVCDVTFIALEQYLKPTDEQRKQDKPILIKVTRRSKDQEEQHKVVARANINKTQHEWQSKKSEVTIQETKKAEIFEKDEIHSKSMTEVKIPQSFGIKEDVRESKTDKIKHSEKKQEYTEIKEQKHSEPDTEVPLADTKGDFKKEKMPKEVSPKTPRQTIKKVSKIPSTEQGFDKVVLKPVARPDKSKAVSMKKKELTPTAKRIEEGVAPKLVVPAAKGEHKEPEVLTKAKRVLTENDEVEKCSYRSSTDQEKSEEDEKPDKDDKVKIQVKKTEESPKEGAKPLTIKKGRHIQKEYEEKEDISLKPVEHIKKDVELEKISPKVEKLEEEKLSLTTLTKTKESPKEEYKTSAFKTSGSLSETIMEEEKISLKPVELFRKEAEVKRTLSPKVEALPLHRKSSATVPKKGSPNDLTESVPLRKVSVSSQQKNASQELPEKEKLSLIKELSPGVLQLQKIPTQKEEEVFEEEFKDENEEEEEEEETWGWELVPAESYEAEKVDSTLENGAIETPGGTNDERGERETRTSPLVFHAFPGLQKIITYNIIL